MLDGGRMSWCQGIPAVDSWHSCFVFILVGLTDARFGPIDFQRSGLGVPVMGSRPFASGLPIYSLIAEALGSRPFESTTHVTCNSIAEALGSGPFESTTHDPFSSSLCCQRLGERTLRVHDPHAPLLGSVSLRNKAFSRSLCLRRSGIQLQSFCNCRSR